MRTEHKVGLSLYVGAATLDYHSTYQSMKVGIPESNPLGRFTEGKPGATVLVGASIDAVVTPLLYRWLGKEHPQAHHRAALHRRGVSDPPGGW